MPRIANKELVVNSQIKMQLENNRKNVDNRQDAVVFDPGWGEVCKDPETGKDVRYYDHVLRNMKLVGGIQIWILVPRYKFVNERGLFRVLPSNLCVYKHYAVDIIQCEIDLAMEKMLPEEENSEADDIQRQLNSTNDAEEYPCDRTRWLWILWFLKNLLLMEAVLMQVHLIAYPVAKKLHLQGAEVHAIYGFRTRDLVILDQEFAGTADLYCRMSDDGTWGEKGLVTDALNHLIESGEKYDEVITIGPLMMMKFVCQLTKSYDIKTVASMNPIMIDGTGMCGGCRLTVGGKMKFACVDGPEFDGHEIDFDEAMARSRIYSEFERQADEHACRLLKEV